VGQRPSPDGVQRALGGGTEGGGPQAVPAVQLDLLVVDLTRLPEQGKGIVENLVAEGVLKGVPVGSGEPEQR
jgi:hypothetical protein